MRLLWACLGNTPPLLLIAAGLIVGDVAGGCWALRYDPPALALFSGGVTVLLSLKGTPRRGGWCLAAAAYAAMAADGVYRPLLPDRHVLHATGSEPQHLEGVIESAQNGGGRSRLLLRCTRRRARGEWVPASGRVRISVRRLHHDWQSGDLVRLRTRLRRPRNFGTPGELDYVAHLARRGIYATGWMDNDNGVELISRRESGLPAALARWRRRVGTLIDTSLSPPNAGILSTLVIGNGAAVSMQQRQAFNRAGVSHVLSISGLHVGLVAGTSYTVCRWLLARSEWLLLAANVPKLAAAFSVLPVLLYGAIAGSSVATVRALIMVILFGGAVLIDRQRNLMAGLAGAAIAVLLLSPGAALDISFQLSFVAVWALARATQRFRAWWPDFAERHLLRLRSDWWARLSRPLLLSLIVSVSAVAATGPLTALHFNQISLIAPLANLVVVPVLGSGAVMLGLVAAFCEPILPDLAQLFVRLAGSCVALGLWLVEAIASIPWAAMRVATPSILQIALTYLLLVILLYSGGRRRIYGGAAAALVLCLTFVPLRNLSGPELRVTFLSIGQGDAAVLEMPSGEVMVVDGGGIGDGSFDVGERVLAPFLWWRGITRVDTLVISHPQFDHFGGLRFVAQEFAPRRVWTSGRTASGKRYSELEATLREHGIAQEALFRGDERRFGDVTLQVLSPEKSQPLRGLNDDSLVLHLTWAGVRILLTGDIETLAENDLLRQAVALRAEILKVPHHGSRTSSSDAFVAAVAPSLAVVSAGADNRFGFPHPKVVRRYLAQRALLMRTDQDGAVEVRVRADGEIRVRPYARPGKAEILAHR
jgi:competence protein ComEC